MGKPTAAKKRSQRQKSDLNGNLSKPMKKEIKTEKVSMNYPLVMRISNGLANLNKDVDQAWKREFINNFRYFLSQVEENVPKISSIHFFHGEK